MKAVTYFLCGGPPRNKWRRYLGCLMVSLHSLRKWHSGPVSLFLGNDVCRDELPPAVTLDGVHVQSVPIAPVTKHAGYVTKATLWRYSDCDETILLDADTVVTGPIDELFGHPFTVVQFAGWVTTGKIVGGRLDQWAAVPEAAALLARCRSYPHPHVNTGVLAWQRYAAILQEWERLSIAGQQCSWTDEYAAQLLITGRDDVRILDDQFNCSPTYGQNRDDARIWHYHGRRYVRKLGESQQYRPHLLEALEANCGGIADWLETIDPALWSLAQ